VSAIIVVLQDKPPNIISISGGQISVEAADAAVNAIVIVVVLQN
jgi:hypothetical protein